jgi:ribosomal protein S18 acetylase RimI-like enzyme
MIHRAAFPESALSKLGPESVRRYYEWQLLGPHEPLALGAFLDERLCGFCFGGTFSGSMAGFLHHNRVYLLWRVLTHPWLATDQVFRKRVLVGTKILKRLRRSTLAKLRTQGGTRRTFGILSIAVHPRGQGLGFGRALMKESESVARQRGFDQIDLTVHTQNHQAVRFYEALLFEKVNQKGVWQGLMRKQLSLTNGPRLTS